MAKTNPLSDAVSRRGNLVLSLPSSPGLTHHKSRFLSEGPEGIWVEAPDVRDRIDPIIAARTPVGVTFKPETGRQIFATTLLRFEADRAQPGGASVNAVLLARPADVQIVQRRANFRVRILPDSGLTLECWIIPRHASLKDRPLPSQRVKLDVRDIRLGGAGVTIPPLPGKPLGLTFDDRLRVQVKLNEIELLVEGRVRTAETAADGAVKTGIRFHFLDDGLDQRLKVSQMARIIAQLELKQVKAVRKQVDEIAA